MSSEFFLQLAFFSPPPSFARRAKPTVSAADDFNATANRREKCRAGVYFS